MVSGWLSIDKRPLGVLLDGQVGDAETFFGAEGEAVYHVVNLEPSGFVIVSADDLVEPVIAFSASGSYDPSEDNPLGALVSSDVPDRIAAARSLERAGAGARIDGSAAGKAAAHEAADEARGKWNRLSSFADASAAAMGIPNVSDLRVAPLVQSTWGQTTVGSYIGGLSCYNYYTPPYEPGNTNNYPCGCVATAMAQLMRYHEYPHESYDWSDMPLSPDNSITVTQRRAIGLLCYYVAESIDTTYASSGSTASLDDASRELVATFEYGNSIHGRDPALGSVLNSMIHPNLDAGLPVLLGLGRTGGGHTVACDGYGYNSYTLYHHLNMGWSGTDNVWYALPVVDATHSYDSVHTCVYNIYTTGSGEIISGRATDLVGNPIAGVSISATVSGGGTYHATTDAAGIYALVKVPSDKYVTVTASKPPHTFTQKSATTKRSADGFSGSGNVWGVDFVSQTASPPTAYDDAVSATSGTTINITLSGSDDGYPIPPGRLAYVITSLPQYGDLADPAVGRIKSVPHTLVNYGSTVKYWPCTYFVGQDSFDFKANDGGTYPQGGDSEPATVTIAVDNVTTTIFAPGDELVASWPMMTSYHDSRTQVIYLAGEIGGAKTITALALDVWEAPGQTLNYWTIRMKHTGRSAYTTYPLLETSGWTTVYWAHEPANPTGWRTFTFQTPFEYNGRDNLLVDFSHDNSYYTEEGLCSVSDMGSDRVLFSYADSTHGSPLTWNDFSAPGLYTSGGVPNIKVIASVQGEPFPSDFVHNCRVDTVDFAVLAAAWLSAPGDSNWEPACDISAPADNFINERDYAVFAEHWLEETE
jgi:hypothetical protein